MINKQEILNKVYTFMMKQMKHCEKPGEDNFQYHYKDLRCNAGVLIPVEDYKPEFEEGFGVDGDNKVTEYFKSKGFDEDDLCWLRDLQIIHDGWEVKDWKPQFESFAITNNLTLPQREFING